MNGENGSPLEAELLTFRVVDTHENLMVYSRGDMPPRFHWDGISAGVIKEIKAVF